MITCPPRWIVRRLLTLLAFSSAVLEYTPASAQSAPVPAAVAIPRPTPAEVTLITSTLDDYKASLPAETQQVLARYPDALQVRLPRPNTATIPKLASSLQKKHQANLAVARTGNIDLLFLGDSITDFWRNAEGDFGGGKPVLDKYWGHLNVANFGIASDTTQGVLYRLQHGEAEGFIPKVVMLMIGTNNTRANTAAEIAEGIGAIVLELQRKSPATKILLLGIFPRGGRSDSIRTKIAETNAIISRLDDGDKVHYLDIGEVFLDAKGNIPADVMSDRLHPTAKGYELWAQAVNGRLAELMRD